MTLGLDLGQAADFTALSVLDQFREPDPKRPNKTHVHHHVRHLQRWPLPTDYTDVAKWLKNHTENRDSPLHGCRCVPDFTGVGRGVLDTLRSPRPSCSFIPITITSGHEVNFDKDFQAWRVPKKDLVSCLLVAMQNDRLKIASGLKDAEVLKKELQNFRVKMSTRSGDELYGAWRDGQHDDYVLSVALAVWVGEELGTGRAHEISSGQEGKRNVCETAPRGVFPSLEG